MVQGEGRHGADRNPARPGLLRPRHRFARADVCGRRCLARPALQCQPARHRGAARPLLRRGTDRAAGGCGGGHGVRHRHRAAQPRRGPASGPAGAGPPGDRVVRTEVAKPRAGAPVGRGRGRARAQRGDARDRAARRQPGLVVPARADRRCQRQRTRERPAGAVGAGGSRRRAGLARTGAPRRLAGVECRDRAAPEAADGVLRVRAPHAASARSLGLGAQPRCRDRVGCARRAGANRRHPHGHHRPRAQPPGLAAHRRPVAAHGGPGRGRRLGARHRDRQDRLDR